MGLGWCKLLMARTHTKKGNKERIKEEAKNQGTIRHFQPDKHLNISKAFWLVNLMPVAHVVLSFFVTEQSLSRVLVPCEMTITLTSILFKAKEIRNV